MLADNFLRMLRERTGAELEDWMNQVRNTRVREFDSFVVGLRRDEATMQAGLTPPFSNGQAERQVTWLRLTKRQGYGKRT